MSSDMNEYSTEIVHKIFNNSEGVHICVGPDRDVGGFVEIYTEDHNSQEYFGEIRFVLPPAMALKLAEALKESAEKLLKE